MEPSRPNVTGYHLILSVSNLIKTSLLSNFLLAALEPSDFIPHHVPQSSILHFYVIAVPSVCRLSVAVSDYKGIPDLLIM